MGQGLNGKESILPDELNSLLTRLHAPETPVESSDDYATVAAVCEATGESEERVWQMLNQIREEDLEARVQERLRQAEEPLYRVERPGVSNDPLDSSTNMLARRRAISTILDKIPRAGFTQPKLPKKETPIDATTNIVSKIVLVFTLALLISAMAIGLIFYNPR